MSEPIQLKQSKKPIPYNNAIRLKRPEDAKITVNGLTPEDTGILVAGDRENLGGYDLFHIGGKIKALSLYIIGDVSDPFEKNIMKRNSYGVGKC